MPSALIALHFQNDTCHPDGRIPFSLNRRTEDAESFLGASRSALLAARTAGWVVCHVHIDFAEDYSDLPRNAPLFRKASELGAVRRGSWGARAYEGFEPLAGEVVISHSCNSAFHGTDLKARLRELKAGRLFVMGMATQFSVESTVRTASDMNYAVTVLSDCVTSGDRTAHDASLRVMTMLGEVLPSRAVF